MCGSPPGSASHGDRRRHDFASLSGLLLVGPLLAVTASASQADEGNGLWEQLMGPGEPTVFSDPRRLFQVDLPSGWRAEPRPAPSTAIDFWRVHPDRGFAARLTIEVHAIPPGARLAHVEARAEEADRKALPGYRAIRTESVRVAGADARRRIFTYRELNHAQRVNEVVKTTLLLGEHRYVLSFETALGASAHFRGDFDRLLASFVPRPSSGSGPLNSSTSGGSTSGGVIPREETADAPRRLRRGEMVNPDSIRY